MTNGAARARIVMRRACPQWLRMPIDHWTHDAVMRDPRSGTLRIVA